MGIINYLNIEKEIEKKFICGLRAVFENDPDFIYNENETETQIMITPEYPDKDADNFQPHIILAGVNYNFKTQSTLLNNYYQDIRDSNGVYLGEKRINIVPYAANLICLGEYFVSKDLANRAAQYMYYIAFDFFNQLKLNISEVNKGTTSPQQQYSEHIFQTPISIQGHVEWQGSKTLEQIDTTTLLRRVDFYYQNL